MIGVGGEIANTSLPRVETHDVVSDFTCAKDIQKPLQDYDIVDAYLSYDSTSISASWPAPAGAIDFNYDFDLNSTPSISS